MTEIRKKILFVDDDANLLDSIQQIMVRFAGKMWGDHTAQDGSRALMTHQHQRIDLLAIQHEVVYVPDGSTAA